LFIVTIKDETFIPEPQIQNFVFFKPPLVGEVWRGLLNNTPDEDI
jgi:hypothetical protein